MLRSEQKPTTTITVNLVESPFRLLHALDIFNGTNKTIKLRGNVDDRIDEFLSSIGQDRDPSETREVKKGFKNYYRTRRCKIKIRT